MLSHTSGALRYTTLSHFHYAQILPKDGVAGRRTRGSGRAGREIVLGKLKKELDVLQRCALSQLTQHLHLQCGVTVAAAAGIGHALVFSESPCALGHAWSNMSASFTSRLRTTRILFFGSAHRLQASGNAVELLGTYEDRSCVYIVMEECRGGDLETLLEVRLPERSTPAWWVMRPQGWVMRLQGWVMCPQG